MTTVPWLHTLQAGGQPPKGDRVLGVQPVNAALYTHGLPSTLVSAEEGHSWARAYHQRSVPYQAPAPPEG